MNALRVSFKRGRFFCKSSYEDRLIPKQAGFRWSNDFKLWYTDEHSVAARLREHADEMAIREMEKALLTIKPWNLPLPKPPEGKILYEHQRDAISFALSRNRVYLGLDPGLGKTIIAAMISRVVHERIVYICPPFLVETVTNEFAIWAPERVTRRLDFGSDMKYNDVLIVPDSLISRPETYEAIKKFVSPAIRPLIFVDEAHRFKSDGAQRTRALLGESMPSIKFDAIVDLFTTQIFMSGTPIPNRPMELYPILAKAAPETIDFMNRFEYGRKYCAGHRNSYGWDFSGASNMECLHSRVIAPSGPFMLRIRKEVLNLPPLVEEVFVIDGQMRSKLARMDADIGRKYADVEDVIKYQIQSSTGKDELHIATYRRLLGQEKIDAAVTYIESLLEETDESILVFAIHKDVIAALDKQLEKHCPLVITGDVPVNHRQDIVNEFQRNPGRRVFIGNIQACGTGFTLTKATRVLFVEYDWVPGNNEQAASRAHRIGTKSTVYVQYMVYKDSIDKAVLESILRKRKTLAHI